MKLVTSSQMRAVDSHAINNLGIPGIELMENAGRGIATWIRDILGGEVSGKRFAIFCGKGNNGGDGYVIARYLLSWGAQPEIFMLASPEEIRGDALTNLQRLQPLELPIRRLDKDNQTWIPAFAGMTHSSGSASIQSTSSTHSTASIESTSSTLSTLNLQNFDLIIDAIFGTGFSGKIDQRTASVIDQINGSSVRILAVDTPTGLISDTGEQPETCIRATYTATLALPKIAQYFYPGRTYCGITTVIDIGIPKKALDVIDSKLLLTSLEYINTTIPDRSPTIHKGDAGKLFILAGSEGLTGAAVMAANSAARAGAGLVTVGCPSSLNDILEIKLTEPMTKPLPEIKKRRCLAARGIGDILAQIKLADAVALGPGVGRHHETVELFRRLVPKLEKPAVLDADGLFAFAGKPDLLKACQADLVLTPHAGEFARLSGQEVGTNNQERMRILSEYSHLIEKVVLLKGAPTLIATPDGAIFVNPTGNPGMATGGSGDVLTGIIGAFLASGMSAVDSAVCGAFIHGWAGDLAREELGTFGMIATDITNFLPKALRIAKD